MYQCNERSIKNKVGLLNLAEELGHISKACKVMGSSRATFYRYQRAVDEEGMATLLEKSRRQQPKVKNRVDEAIEQAVIAFAVKYPAHGQLWAPSRSSFQTTSVSPVRKTSRASVKLGRLFLVPEI